MITVCKYLHVLSRIRSLVLIFVAVVVVGNHYSVKGQSSTDLIKVEGLFNAANSLLASGKANEAIKKYTEAIAIAPSLPLPYLNRGAGYISLSKFLEALSDADKALSLFVTGSHDPGNIAIAYQIKGLVNQNLGNYKLAADLFSKSIELDPTNAKYRNGRGNAYRLLGDYDSALKDFDKAIELDASQPGFYTNRSAIKRHLKDYDSSLMDLNEALKLNRNYGPAYYGRANTYLELKKFDEALKDFDRAILLTPKSEYYHGRGRVYFVLGEFDRAINDNTEAINLDNSNIEAYGNRAVTYSRIGKYSLAIEDVRKALALKGDTPVNRHRLAYLLYKAGKYPEASEEATRAINALPQWREPFLLRAAAYSKMGNTAKAMADRQTAAKLSPKYKPVDDYTVFNIQIDLPEDIDQ